MRPAHFRPLSLSNGWRPILNTSSPLIGRYSSGSLSLLGAGIIISSGTVSNADQRHGYSCIAEIRMIETINNGVPETPFMQYGDRIELDVQDDEGKSIFGSIDQYVTKWPSDVEEQSTAE